MDTDIGKAIEIVLYVLIFSRHSQKREYFTMIYLVNHEKLILVCEIISKNKVTPENSGRCMW